jgi:hypothetical protein
MQQFNTQNVTKKPPRVLGFTRRDDTASSTHSGIIFALHCTYLPEGIKASRQHSLRIAMRYA